MPSSPEKACLLIAVGGQLPNIVKLLEATFALALEEAYLYSSKDMSIRLLSLIQSGGYEAFGFPQVDTAKSRMTGAAHPMASKALELSTVRPFSAKASEYLIKE